MIGLAFVDIVTAASAILVVVAVVMTVVLWRDEGRRSAQHTRAQSRHTSLGTDDGEPTRDEREDAQVSA